MKRVAVAVMSCLAFGCGDDGVPGRLFYDASLGDAADTDATPGPDTGTLSDAGRDTGPDAAVSPPGCGTPPAGTVSGTRTAHPHIAINFSPATTFSLLSSNFRIEDEDDPEREPLLRWYAEIQSNVSTPQCGLFAEVELLAPSAREIVTIVETDRYEDRFEIRSRCIGLGEVAILVGVQRGISSADLDDASFLSVRIDDPWARDDVFPVVGGPVLTRQTAASTAEGFVVDAEIRVPENIWNYGYRAYPRDARGLLIDELLAFPGELETLYAGSTHAFSTDANPCPFGEFLSLQTWLDGEASKSNARTPSERRRAAIRSEMRQLEAGR